MPATGNARIRVIGVLCAMTAVLLAVPAQAHAVRARPRALPVVVHREPPPTPSAQPSIGAPQPERYPDAPVTINSLTRDSFGIVTAVWQVKYTGNSSLQPSNDWQGLYTYADAPVSGVTLTDETGKVRYHPLRFDPRRECVCNSNADQPNPMDPGDIGYYTESFKLPMNVKSVTFTIASYAPAKNVPISNAA